MLHALLFWPFAFWFFGPFHSLFSLFFLILIFGLIFGRRRYYYGYHPYWWRHPYDDNRAAARRILEERYAKGEIQRDEYLQKRQDLGG
ncbi:MAG TPA: hypothetical protein VG387_12855 [Rhizomicrobium sp.]|jgi:putative membrane protein|nr:hypothetical protein [Rhizomicrobium sp.]